MSHFRTLRAGLVALLLALGGGAGWAETADEHELKAAYIYRFAQFTTWMDPPFGEFDFCVQGDHEIEGGLRKLRGKTVQNAPVSVRWVDLPEAAKNCHVLFLHPDKRSELVNWIAVLKPYPVLVVSDLPEAFQEDAMIVFAMEPNRVTFKINRTRANASGLFLSSQMLKLAKEIR